VPHTLLLADDSVTIQRVIELTFADEDVNVIAVSDGDQAIERLESSPPDIVLADIGMPGKNGYEVAKYIKQSPKLSHIPVVLLTGAFEPVDQARATEAGCDGVLAKPFEPQLVIGRVKDLLAKSHQVPASVDDTLAPPPPLSPPPSPPEGWTAAAPPSAPLDDYFDRLDAAFQTLSGPGTAAAAPKTAAPPAEAAPDIDWFSSNNTESPAPAAMPWDLPAPETSATEPAADLLLSYESPQPPVDSAAEIGGAGAPAAFAEPPADESVAIADEPPPAAAAPSPEPVTMTPAPAAVPPAERPRISALPSLADAFAAILAAEQSEPVPSASATWPATSASTDELFDRIARRVLDRLSDKVVRETVAELVSQIAERLIREEIERIKASIR
jgi:CheY-like chemotaxis protein